MRGSTSIPAEEALSDLSGMLIDVLIGLTLSSNPAEARFRVDGSHRVVDRQSGSHPLESEQRRPIPDADLF